MFPTFDVPPQEAETIKSRRARKVKDDATSSLSGGSVRSEEATHSSSKKTGGFGWFSKSKKNEIKEIPVLPSLKQSQRHLQEPPLPPPTKALPSPPPLPGLLNPMSETSSRNDPRRRTQHSDYSQASGSSAGGSVFSRQSRAETAISEESFSRKSRTETVLSEESFSSHVDNNRQAQGPFARALAKMESAGPRIMSARLEEQWEGLDDDESYQEVAFEKRLWALTAYQRLVQNKQLQSPAHELLSNSRPADQRRILHLYGSLGTYSRKLHAHFAVTDHHSRWMDACGLLLCSNRLYCIVHAVHNHTYTLPRTAQPSPPIRPLCRLAPALPGQLL